MHALSLSLLSFAASAPMKWIFVSNVNTRCLTNFLSMFGLFSNGLIIGMERKRAKNTETTILSFEWSYDRSHKVNSYRMKHIRLTAFHSLISCVFFSLVVNALTPQKSLSFDAFDFCSRATYVPNSFDGYPFIRWWFLFSRILFYFILSLGAILFATFRMKKYFLAGKSREKKAPHLDLASRADIHINANEAMARYMCKDHLHLFVITIREVSSLSYSLRSFSLCIFQ